MTKNAFGMINAFISLIMIPFNILLAILKGIEQNEKDQSMIRRREILNESTRSMMESREIMNQARIKRIEFMSLQHEKELAEIRYKEAMTELAHARVALLRAGVAADGEDADLIGAIFVKCSDCGGQQSQHVGNTCVTCGSHNLKKFHLEVRN